MPTKLPRIGLTVSPQLHAALGELRRVSGMSSASFLSSILEESVPMIEAVTESFKLAKSGVRAPLEPMKDVLAKAMVAGAQVSLDLHKPVKPKRIRKTSGK